MKIEQGLWKKTSGIKLFHDEALEKKSQLVLYFGPRDQVIENSVYSELRKRYSNADIVGCSTGGNILEDELYENEVVFSAIFFEKSSVFVEKTSISSPEDSFYAGQRISKKLQKNNLAGLFVLSKGLDVNGSEFVNGIKKEIGADKNIPVVGGLAGDDDKLEITAVVVNGVVDVNGAVGIGFYGDKIEIKTGAHGGWEEFGPERTITKSNGNILYELDGKPALDLYKTYLGDDAKNLPYSGLFFPLAVWDESKGSDSYVIRTPTSINEEDRSITFAGDVPDGYKSRLMWGKIDGVTDGAGYACKEASFDSANEVNAIHILISCVGRKALMGQKIIGEIELSRKILHKHGKIIGFYSYGEIAPKKNSGLMMLHNETMTVGSIREIA